jgi:cytidylate kinase
LLVTISGLPGSGTTTVSRLVADALGVERLPGGEVFRQMAAEAGMSLAEFGAFVQGHPEIDRELDDRLQARAAEGDCVIESRLAGLRAARVAEREGTSITQALIDNADRSDLERARYQSVYRIDLDDRSTYDLVLDSTREPAEVLAAAIVGQARATFD